MKTLKTENLMARFKPGMPANPLVANAAERHRRKPHGVAHRGLSRAEIRQIVLEMIG